MKKRQRLQEIYDFELQQFSWAEQTRKNNEEANAARIREQQKAEERERRVREEAERVRNLSPEQRLYEAREHYYRYEVPQVISNYRKESKHYRSAHNRYQWIIIIGSAVVTSLTGATVFTSLVTISFVFKVIAALCSLLVTIAAGFMGYFKYRERSNNLQKAADDIEQEYFAIQLGTHAYANKSREEALGLFADRVLKRIKEQQDEQQVLEQPPDAKPLPQQHA